MFLAAAVWRKVSTPLRWDGRGRQWFWFKLPKTLPLFMNIHRFFNRCFPFCILLLGLFPEALNIVCLLSFLGFYNFHQFHYRRGWHSSSQSYAESQSQGCVLDQAMKGGLGVGWCLEAGKQSGT